MKLSELRVFIQPRKKQLMQPIRISKHLAVESSLSKDEMDYSEIKILSLQEMIHARQKINDSGKR